MNSMDGASWYLWGADGAQGPYTAAQLSEWLAQGVITTGWNAWREGMEAWKPLAEIPGLTRPAAPTAPIPSLAPRPAASPAREPTPLPDSPSPLPARPAKKKSEKREGRGFSLMPILLPVFLAALGYGGWIAAKEPTDPAYVVCREFSDAMFRRDFAAAKAVAAEGALSEATIAEQNPRMTGLPGQSGEPIRFTCRTLGAVGPSSGEKEAVGFLESIVRANGGVEHYQVTAETVRTAEGRRVCFFHREEAAGSNPLHEIRLLVAKTGVKF